MTGQGSISDGCLNFNGNVNGEHLLKRHHGDSAAATSNPGFQAMNNWARCIHAEAEADDKQSWNISH